MNEKVLLSARVSIFKKSAANRKMVDTSPRVSVYKSPNDDESLATFHPPVCMEGAFICMVLDCSGSMAASYCMMRTWVQRFLESLPLNVGLVIVAYGSNASVLASTSAMTASEKSQYIMSVSKEKRKR